LGVTDVFDRERQDSRVLKRSRRLRTVMTYPERLLWEVLRRHTLPIRKQAPVGRYVADFACHSARLIIEVDGYPHSLPVVQKRDAVRDAWLRSQGYQVLRFRNQQVVENIQVVVEAILDALPPRWGKGRDGGVPPELHALAREAGTPQLPVPNTLWHTPTQPSPIEGEGAPYSDPTVCELGS
jgi:very-short-patch-repair endonuclease